MEYNALAEGGIVILGGGPCGGAVALGLRQLGYDVTLIAEPRNNLVIEGVTEKTLGQLKRAGFSFALRNLPVASPRRVTWNSESRNTSERLCNRTEMDRDILLDLQSAGVHVIEGRAGKIAAFGNGYQVEVLSSDRSLLIPACFVVEARGRSAPAGELQRLRGEDTISLQYFWRDTPVEPGSVMESYRNGFIWLASWKDGSRYAQITLDARHNLLPEKQQLATFCRDQLMQLEYAAELVGSIPLNGLVTARASTPVLCLDSVSENWIRVGDAAVSFDPVTDSCLATSLSCAMAVPAVINTLIQKPENSGLARQFYSELLEHHFFNTGRRNREQFAREKRWSDEPFWQQRRVWPDPGLAYQSLSSQQAWIEHRPIQKNELIEMAEVVVTQDQPLGIRDLEGLPLVAMVKAIQHRKGREPLESCLKREAGIPEEQGAYLINWMREKHWVA